MKVHLDTLQVLDVLCVYGLHRIHLSNSKQKEMWREEKSQADEIFREASWVSPQWATALSQPAGLLQGGKIFACLPSIGISLRVI